MVGKSEEFIRLEQLYKSTVEHLNLIIDVQIDCDNIVLMGLEIFN